MESVRAGQAVSATGISAQRHHAQVAALVAFKTLDSRQRAEVQTDIAITWARLCCEYICFSCICGGRVRGRRTEAGQRPRLPASAHGTRATPWHIFP
jgi:hypothetical protein